jgi:hypothetical protein
MSKPIDIRIPPWWMNLATATSTDKTCISRRLTFSTISAEDEEGRDEK